MDGIVTSRPPLARHGVQFQSTRDCYALFELRSMENTATDRKTIQDIAESVLDGRMSTLEAVRVLLPLLRRRPEIASQEDFNFVRAVESETDDLPIGQVRQLWDTIALAKRDAEVARCESLWRDQF